ncbi:hypothetical protein [Streptacidiphilus sp. P02-A3a]|uniref:hypothetical protein n=1 Tax=Streptacidiphilus sp. P02-A3a TaxID=2704468 RepID=UPI0015FCC9C6|nr:hypothetical protein [Streptacidiphilus sp. P02-A3a]QMU70011.1 hypothetical protein GXP74_19060 [Streptacidiphilus sp. P02-A3a]
MGTVGAVLGTGAGRGVGLLYVLLGCAVALLGLVCLRIPVLGRFDREVPDAPAADLVGLTQLGSAVDDPAEPGTARRSRP